MARIDAPRVGDIVKAECTDTASTTVTAELVVDRVDQLGCGCWRLDVERPGPKPSPVARMHLLTGCGRHPNNLI